MAKILIRFLLPLVAVLAVLAYICLPYAEHLTDQWFERDLEIRSQLVFNTLEDTLEDSLAAGNHDRIQQLFKHVTQDEHVLALGYCDPKGTLSYKSGNFPGKFTCSDGASAMDEPVFTPWTTGNSAILIAKFPVLGTNNNGGTLVLLNDLSFLQHRMRDAHNALFIFLFTVCFISAFVTMMIAFFTLRSWLKSVRRLLQEDNFEKIDRRKLPAELRPLVLDLYRLLRRRTRNRHTANPARTVWEPETLRQMLKGELPGEEIFVVSNREPYIHNEDNGKTVMQTPAGGLVSALEPVMRACRGTWIAHGSGTADKMTVDRNDHISVPPDNPTYTLRRMWLTEKEEEGFYHGFANEGLWPLCHLVFTRPVFREEDWAYYQAVNRKFADAVVAEAKTKTPIVLVQDYHFALLPQLIRERLPNAIIATFWHIPWPNAESFSICPWREELLKGLLGSDILGFHTQFHCNNFFETADRFLETRIDRERATVTVGGRASLVRPYPISIEWLPAVVDTLPPVAACRENVLRQLHLPADLKLGVGVERFDYTKGIMDRFQAVERFFRQNPTWIGKFSFIQVAAPTRSKLARYREVQDETIKTAEAINADLGRNGWKPIILVTEAYDQRRVFELFRAGDLCMVSSLHDGMNLVAKEFVAAREDERGTLILSTFAGASEELVEALIVNPHDTKGMADAIKRALSMSPSEQQQRMHILRSVVRDRNVYWWAAQMLLDVARIRKSRAISAVTDGAGKRGDIYGLLPGRAALRKLLQAASGKKAA